MFERLKYKLTKAIANSMLGREIQAGKVIKMEVLIPPRSN